MRLVENETFGTLEIDFYVDENRNIYVTIEQLAAGFGYKSRNSIDVMMNRQHYLRENKFSVPYSLSGTDGKQYETRLFNKRGIYEIGMLSRTKQGKTFRNWLYDYIEELEQENFEFRLQRALEKPERQDLTDIIQEKGLSPHYYKHYTDLLFKSVTGMNAKQLKDQRGEASTALDLLTAEEMEHYRQYERVAISLIDLQWPYEDVKTVLRKEVDANADNIG
ncbi:BRO family protein [Dolosigranulum savutiense]|uniref:BRO family protein n=1 Tax=Dolosigranulum savutiense TaxID=3110288 RepID=A0AB74TZ76_9LACT